MGCDGFRRSLRVVLVSLTVVTYAAVAYTALLSFSARADEKVRKVIFFGDSLTSGYGVSREEAFPAKVRELARRTGTTLEILNAGASGDTTAGGLRRVDWVTRERPDVFVLCLGANDGLRGLSLENTRANLVEISRRVRSKFPGVPILLLRMELPPTFGEPYITQFRKLFEEVAKEASVVLGPFLLEKVAGNPELNLPDRIHPNAKGHELLAETVWGALEPLLHK